VLALVLAPVGIYGVVSYAVVGRYQEIGVRLALGATAWSVLGLVLRQTMRPVVVGAVLAVWNHAIVGGNSEGAPPHPRMT
jgi:putative ABC transport system permease protein